MKRKELEIYLSQVNNFLKPKIELEQYQTPARVAANLLHWAFMSGDIANKNVIDLCSGTGILGIGAALLGANVSCVEIDSDAINILKSNVSFFDLDIEIIHSDVFNVNSRYDVAIINPPFGIQQKKHRDIDFLLHASKLAPTLYSIHDASPANIENIPILLKSNNIIPIDYYIDEFPLTKSYPWHKYNQKIMRVMVIRSKIFSVSS